MKQLGLDGKYNIVTISDEAYKQIMLIVALGLVCGKCGHPYDQHFPCVELNLCLECFQKKHQGKKLTYNGLFEKNENGDETHIFLDPEGYVYLTATTSDSEPHKSSYHTLKYHGYPVPERIVRDEKEVELSSWYWSIYGNVKENSVLYIENSGRFTGEKTVAFLTYQHDRFEEVNKRAGKFRKLFRDAKSFLKATKDSEGYYHIGERKSYQIYDSYLYEVVSDLASGEHDQKQRRSS